MCAQAWACSSYLACARKRPATSQKAECSSVRAFPLTSPAPAWRRRPQRHLPCTVRASSEDDLDKQLQADLERLRQRQAAAGSNGSVPAAPRQQQAAARPAAGAEGEGGAPLGGLKDAIDKLLIADFFFILFSLGWLGAALAARSALQSTALLDSWLSLWQWVFQPAIGVLMLGALLSGAVGWAKENLGK